MLAASRKTLTAIATVSASPRGGAALAGAATNSSSSSSSSASQRVQDTALTGAGRGGPGHRGGGGPRDEALTGTTAAKVKAAVLEKVPGGTVLRTEKGGHDGAAYHAHVRKSDGTEVVVLVNSAFEATSVKEFTRPSILSEGCRCCTPPAPTGATTSAASCATSSSASACGPSATCVAATAAMTRACHPSRPQDFSTPRWPTLGVKVVPSLPAGAAELFPGVALPALPPVTLLEQVVATAIVGHDQTYLERPCVRGRTIFVDTSSVGIVEFDASDGQRATAIANGTAAAEDFLRTWDWDEFQRECRPLPAA